MDVCRAYVSWLLWVNYYYYYIDQVFWNLLCLRLFVNCWTLINSFYTVSLCTCHSTVSEVIFKVKLKLQQVETIFLRLIDFELILEATLNKSRLWIYSCDKIFSSDLKLTIVAELNWHLLQPDLPTFKGNHYKRFSQSSQIKLRKYSRW